jgi:hypothetical protein
MGCRPRDGRELVTLEILTPGQRHDITQAEGLISGISFENLFADKGCDSDYFRALSQTQALRPWFR